MKGLKTVLAALVGGPLSAWVVTNLGIPLGPEEQAYIVGGIMSGLMVVMRVVSTGPVRWLVPKKGGMTEEQLVTVIKLIRAELKREKEGS